MIEFRKIKNYSAYIFDFDGVLYNTHWANQKAYQVAFAELNIKVDEYHLNNINGQSWDQFLLSQGLELNNDQIKTLRDTKAQAYPSFFHLIEKNEVLFNFINELKAQSKILYIASSASAVNITNVLHYFKDYQFFDNILCRDDIDHPKPHPEIYNKCLDSLGLSADDCIVFEDSEDGALAAHAAGIRTIEVDTFKYGRSKQ